MSKVQSKTTQHEALTQTQSTTLVKNMMRIAISSIAKIRKLFQNECFSREYLGDTTIYRLMSANIDENGKLKSRNQQAFRLMNYLGTWFEIVTHIYSLTHYFTTTRIGYIRIIRSRLPQKHQVCYIHKGFGRTRWDCRDIWLCYWLWQ